MENLDVKKNLLLHSQAKVEFFRRYLDRYLRIVSLSRKFSQINIFDVFCGTGIYEDGRKGSPLEAFDAIKDLKETWSGVDTPIALYVNDGDPTKVEVVKNYIEAENRGFCSVEFWSNDAEEAFGRVQAIVDNGGQGSRNLVFVDPYGYKHISRETIYRLLKGGNTELILFLPISHMQRFTMKAVASEDKPYIPLKKFVEDFFQQDHAIHKGTLSVDEYTESVTEALRFDEFFATSFRIQRDRSNQYALFFVTPNLYGFHKILEVKWKMDEDEGRGFHQPPAATSLFAQQERDLVREDNYSRLRELLEAFLQKERTNNEIYVYTLQNEYLPTHAVAVLGQWQKEDRLEVTDLKTGKAARKGSFYLNWEDYKSQEPRVRFNLASGGGIV